MINRTRFKVNGISSSRGNARLNSATDWMNKSRKDILDGVERLKNIDHEKYLQIVDDAIDKYTKSVKSSEVVRSATKEIKAAWPRILKAKKVAIKATKKIIKKVK